MKVKRILAFYLDIMILSFVPCLIKIIYLWFDYHGIAFGLIFNFYCVIAVIFKDLIFKNQSIGKKILKLEIRSSDGKKASTLQVILRNVTLIIWPIEFVCLLITNKRIGDIIFKTIVVEK